MKSRSKYKELFGNMMVFAISNIGTKIILFFLVPLYTKYLSSGEYGDAEIIVTTTNLIIPVVTLAINEAVYRFTMDRDSEKKEILKCFYYVYFFSIIATALATLILCFIPSLSEYKAYFALITLSTILNDGYALYIKGNGKNKVFAFDNIIYVLALALFNVFFLVVLHWGACGYLTAIFASKFVSFLFLLVFGGECKFIIPLNPDKALLKKMLHYSTPLLFNSINWWVIASLDKYMLSYFAGNSAVGLYTVASKVPSLVNTATTVFTEAWTISSIREYNEKSNNSFYDEVFSMFNAFMALLTSFILLIARPFMGFYVSESYYSAVVLLPTLLLSAYFLGYASFMSVTFSTVMKSKIIMKSSLFSAIINIILNLILIPFIGGLGAAIATMATYAVIALYRFMEAQKYMPVHVSAFQLLLTIALLLIQVVFVTIGKYWISGSIIILVFVILLHRRTAFMVARKTCSLLHKIINNIGRSK